MVLPQPLVSFTALLTANNLQANATNKIYCWAVGRPSDGTVVLKGSLDKEAYKSVSVAQPTNLNGRCRLTLLLHQKNCEAMISQCLRESGKVKNVMSYTKSDLRIGISPHKSASVFFVGVQPRLHSSRPRLSQSPPLPVCAEKNYPDDGMR